MRTAADLGAWLATVDMLPSETSRYSAVPRLQGLSVMPMAAGASRR